MKTIIINEDYKVEVDELNKTLKQKQIIKKKDTGEFKESWNVVGYYGTWEQVFDKILDLNILGEIASEGLVDLKYVIIEAKKDIVNAIKELKL